jgi:hypothetical protein
MRKDIKGEECSFQVGKHATHSKRKLNSVKTKKHEGWLTCGLRRTAARAISSVRESCDEEGRNSIRRYILSKEMVY